MYQVRRHPQTEFVPIRNLSYHVRIWGDARSDQELLAKFYKRDVNVVMDEMSTEEIAAIDPAYDQLIKPRPIAAERAQHRGGAELRPRPQRQAHRRVPDAFALPDQPHYGGVVHYRLRAQHLGGFLCAGHLED